jgi:SAM-dependent methyltransferase
MELLFYPQIRDRTEVDAETIQNQIAIKHQTEPYLSDREIDKLLGIPRQNRREDLSIYDLTARYGPEQYAYEGTSYDSIRQFLSNVDITQHDVIYDLGCGYGRFIFYGALLYDATFRGIEIVPERIAYAEAIRRRLGLNNVRLLLGNVLNHSWSDGTIFFLFNPFTAETMNRVIERLYSISLVRKITILSWGGGGSNQFLAQNWLKQSQIDQGLLMFESKKT